MNGVWNLKSANQCIVCCLVEVQVFIIGGDTIYLLIFKIYNIIDNEPTKTKRLRLLEIFRFY